MLSRCFPKLQLKKASSELCVIYKVIKLSFINSLKALKFHNLFRADSVSEAFPVSINSLTERLLIRAWGKNAYVQTVIF